MTHTTNDTTSNDTWDVFAPFCPTIGPYLTDDSISEIQVNADGRLFYERAGISYLSSETVTQSEVEDTATRIARWQFKDVSDWAPLLIMRMPNGDRVAVTAPPVSEGWCMSIRRYNNHRFTIEELIRVGTLTIDTAQILQKVVEGRKTILISGATSTGKTTFLNALASFLPSQERILLIEDTSEIHIHARNLVRWEARPKTENRSEVSIRDLVKHALRFTPDRIILGEVRGDEAFDLLQVLNTGHAGSMSTIHANSAAGALKRLASLSLLVSENVPLTFLKESAAEAINVIVQLERQTDGARRIREIVSIDGYRSDTDKFETHPLYSA